MLEPVDVVRPSAEVRRLLDDGRYAQAEALARELLGQVESTGDGHSLSAAGALDLLAEALRHGEHSSQPETLSVAERALRLKEELLGLDDPGVALSLHNLAIVHYRRSDFAAAKPLLERALAIRERRTGPESPEVATSLIFLGSLLFDEEPDEVLGRRAAESLFRRAQAIQERTLDRDHRDVAWWFTRWGYIQEWSGDEVGAEHSYRRALEICERALHPGHPLLAASFDDLGSLLVVRGDYGEARRLLAEGLRIRREALGSHHALVAWNLIGLAIVLETTGDLESPLPLYLEARAIFEELGELDGSRLSWCLLNLGRLHRSRGEPVEAREILEQAAGIAEHTVAGGPELLAQILNELGGLLLAQAETERGRQCTERAREIWEDAYGSEWPYLAAILGNLARSSAEQGDSQAAEALLSRGLEIQERTLSADHPEVAWTLARLAPLLAENGQIPEAFAAALRAERIGREHLRGSARWLAESAALRLAAVRSSGQDLAISLALEIGVEGRSSKALDAVIRSRALMLDEMAARSRFSAVVSDPELARLADELAKARVRLSNLAVRGPGPEDPQRYQRALAAARHDKSQAEQALADASASFRQEEAGERIGLGEVTAALEPESALLAYCRYSRQPVFERESSTPAGPLALEPVPAYAAFILRPGASEPTLVPLADALEIDGGVSSWLAAVGAASSASEMACRAAGEELARLLWQPVAAHLDAVRRVFVVPDGPIHLVNLAALPAPGERYLVETGPTLHYLSAERDVVLWRDSAPAGRGLLALGGVSFDRIASAAKPSSADAPTPRGAGSDLPDYTGFHFAALPGSEQEVEAIAETWLRSRAQCVQRDVGAEDVLLLEGTEASEAAFKARAPGRRVVHLATHGFFVDPRARSPAAGERGVGLGGPASAPEPAPLRWIEGGEHALLASGLALAGANLRAAAGLDEEDGVLTAEEIAALDLGGVQWAVLSACGTAIGELRAGEGVFGLRRAFQIAGARTLITTLWPVEDDPAREWMQALYRARLDTGLDTADSARAASVEVLCARRASSRSTHPFYWAAFVAAGDWR